MRLDSGSLEGEQLRSIEKITDSQIAQLPIDEMLVELVDQVLDLLSADAAAILLLNVRSGQLVARFARGIEEEVRQGVQIPLGSGFAGTIAERATPLAIDHVDETTVANPILWEKGLKAMLGVPLMHGQDVIGVLHVGTLSNRRFGENDTALLEQVATRIASAIQVRQLDDERAAASILQRSLLPAHVPHCPGVEFATRYVPAEQGGVGGDWYDAFVVDNGDLWVMTGDVMGHGLRAAVVMGRLRSSLRSYALEGHSPTEVLALADRKLQFFEPGETATVLCAVLSPPYDTVRLSSAGHLPPVLSAPGTESELLELALAPPLGVVDDLSAAPRTVALPPGAVLLAYTDGLVERRGESIDVGLERVRRAVVPGEPEAVCRHVMESLIGRIPARDDIAVIALRRAAAVPT